MKHTELTVRNYSSFAVTILLMSSVGVGFGAIDLAMIAPKGVLHVAAVGQADLIVAGLFALFSGVVDTFASRLAMSEGRGGGLERLGVLGAALLIMAVLCEGVGLLVALGIDPVLRALHQNSTLVPLVGHYVAVRLGSAGLLVLYAATNEALKICGLKNRSFAVLLVGFGVNALLDWVFLYTGCSSLFPSPEAAVSSATVASQLVMTVCCLTVFVRAMRKRFQVFSRPARSEVLAEFGSMARTAPGIGVRHVNDYMGAIVPMMFIGTLGIQPLAAYGLAAKIYTIFCRIPQSCVAASFIYYSYQVGREVTPGQLARIARKLLTYTAVPTAVGAVCVLAGAPWLVKAFGSSAIDTGAAKTMLLAFMATIPLYIFEATYGEFLSVHQRGGLLSATSTLTTWFIMIPLAGLGVFVLKSAALAFVLGSVTATVVIVAVFGRALHKDHWAQTADARVEVQVA